MYIQLLSHLSEQKLKHERMIQLQNQIMSENARLHGAIQVAGDNLERTGHISRDLEFANQMVRDENQRWVLGSAFRDPGQGARQRGDKVPRFRSPLLFSSLHQFNVIRILQLFNASSSKRK